MEMFLHTWLLEVLPTLNKFDLRGLCLDASFPLHRPEAQIDGSGHDINSQPAP